MKMIPTMPPARTSAMAPTAATASAMPPDFVIPADILDRVRALTATARDLADKADRRPGKLSALRKRLAEVRAERAAAEAANIQALRYRVAGGTQPLGPLDEEIDRTEREILGIERSPDPTVVLAQVKKDLATAAADLAAIAEPARAAVRDWWRGRIDDVAHEARALIALADALGIETYGGRYDTHPCDGSRISIDTVGPLKPLIGTLNDCRMVTKAADRVL